MLILEGRHQSFNCGGIASLLMIARRDREG
jgi:hypothetical protein